MKNIKAIINKLILTIIISTILFDLIDIDSTLYFSIIILIWAYVILNFRIRRNLELYDSVILVCLGNFVPYLLINNNVSYLAAVVYIFYLFIVSAISFIVFYSNKKTIEDLPVLMSKRKKDLEGLLYYINMFDIVGLNGRWGTGKSFLIDRLKENINDDYEIIEIDLLSSNLNELQLILIKEIEKVLYKNRILSKYSNRLKRFLSDDTFVFKLHSLFFDDNTSYSETIKGLQDELSRLDKKILVIYEDVDRIDDVDNIKKIFGISEKLSNNRIKIIYQYYEQKLLDMGFNPEYLEKYIPFKMNITESDFFEILHFKFQENNYDEDILKVKDFDFLREYKQIYRYNLLHSEFGIEIEISLVLSNVSIRKVENFLKETAKIVAKDEYKGYKETVISFLFVKHFIPKVYEKLNTEQGLLDTLKFEVDSELYTMPELIDMYKIGSLSKEVIEDVFKNDDNKMNYCILKLFNYSNIQIIEVDNLEKKLQSILEEPINTLKYRNDNEKKDRLIWSLLAHGKSYYTDYEYVGREFIKGVLDKPSAERKKAYSKFADKMFNLDTLEIDNTTIFKLGIPPYIELFKAFTILGVGDEDQIALVDFYFEDADIKEFTVELIHCLNYCGLKTRREYLFILSKFNKLTVTGNLNSKICFSDFLKKYIRALSGLGYIDTSAYNIDIWSRKINEDSSFMISSLNEIGQDLSKLKDKLKNILNFEELEGEFDILIKFIDKLIEIIACDKEVTNKKYGFVNTSFSSKYLNQEEFDRLRNLYIEGHNIIDEAKESYLSGKITVYEIDKLLDELDI